MIKLLEQTRSNPMPTLNEVKYAGMEVDGATALKLNEREHEWLTLQGVTTGKTLDEKWYELFGGSGAWNSDAHAWLTTQGVSEEGTLNERFYRYWFGEIITPPDPSTYDPLEASPDWTAVDNLPSTAKWVDGEISQQASDPAETLVYMNGSLGTDQVCQFRIGTAVQTIQDASFQCVVRATNSQNFIGARLYDNELQVFQRVAGAFTGLYGMAAPPKNTLVQLWVSGANLILRINGVNFKPNQTSLLTAGYCGLVTRAAVNVPYTLGFDYAYAVQS
jgi:hypothetical protein